MDKKPQRKYGKGLVFGSAALVSAILLFEGGLRPDGSSKVYADNLAKGLPTVCAGLTRHVTKTPIIVGEVWSKAKCEREMAAALTDVQTELQLCFGPQPPQHVFDAATSFAWNVGVPSVCGSRAMRHWQQGEWQAGCKAMIYAPDGRLVWVFAGGKFVQGLFNRREKEMAWCATGKVPT